MSAGPRSRALVAEAIGTFALVFAGAGAVMVDGKTHALGQVGVASGSRGTIYPAGPTGLR